MDICLFIMFREYSGTSEERPTWDREILPLFGGWSLLEVNPFYN